MWDSPRSGSFGIDFVDRSARRETAAALRGIGAVSEKSGGFGDLALRFGRCGAFCGLHPRRYGQIATEL